MIQASAFSGITTLKKGQYSETLIHFYVYQQVTCTIRLLYNASPPGRLAHTDWSLLLVVVP